MSKVDTTRWVVVIRGGSWARCYGIFDSYDEVIAWVRENQFDPEDAHIHPIMDAVRKP